MVLSWFSFSLLSLVLSDYKGGNIFLRITTAEASRRICLYTDCQRSRAGCRLNRHISTQTSTVCCILDYTKRNFPDFNESRKSVRVNAFQKMSLQTPPAAPVTGLLRNAVCIGKFNKLFSIAKRKLKNKVIYFRNFRK